MGFTGLTIGQLAEHTGMSKSGLFAHFKSKEAMQLETLERARERFTDLVDPADAGRAAGGGRGSAPSSTAGSTGRPRPSQGGCIFVTASAEFDDQPGPMRDAVVRSQQDWMDFVATVAGTAVTDGDFRADLDTEQLAFTLQGLMLGYHHAARLMRDPKALDHTRRALDQLLEASAA